MHDIENETWKLRAQLTLHDAVKLPKSDQCEGASRQRKTARSSRRTAPRYPAFNMQERGKTKETLRAPVTRSTHGRYDGQRAWKRKDILDTSALPEERDLNCKSQQEISEVQIAQRSRSQPPMLMTPSPSPSSLNIPGCRTSV